MRWQTASHGFQPVNMVSEQKSVGLEELMAIVKERMALGWECCTQCNTSKPPTDFYRSASARNGLMSVCKACMGLRTQAARHGLEFGQYDILVKRQGGGCAICGRSGVRLAVDHDHSRGCRGGHDKRASCAICRRGLLCSQCNTALGMFQDDTEVMAKAIEYLNTWRNHGH